MNVIQSIEKRQTIKVLASKPKATKSIDEKLIETLVKSAYWAPFHKPCDSIYRNNSNGLQAIMPWRFYILDSTNCRKLAEILKDKDICMGKIEPMLFAADYLIQATWTPNNPAKSKKGDKSALFQGSMENMEHIAAAGAAIQNLLLTATHLDMENYWSSGGCLRNKKVFKKLGIDKKEILLGSLFLFPKESKGDESLECLASKMRSKRGDVAKSYKVVDL